MYHGGGGVLNIQPVSHFYQHTCTGPASVVVVVIAFLNKHRHRFWTLNLNPIPLNADMSP